MEKKKIEIVKKLINMNLLLEQIMEATGLSEKHVKEIKSKLS